MTSIIRSAGLIFIFSIVLSLIMPCLASNNINIDGTVTPTSGKEDAKFTYSAIIKFPGGSIENPDINGALNIKLIISDSSVSRNFSESGKFQGNGLSPEELIKGQSNPYTFGPYNLVQQGLKNIGELSYEFVLTSSSGKELARNKYPGPEIVIPPEFQSPPQYNKVPRYYFQDFPITLTFNDKPSVIPSLKLSFQGPLNSSEEMSWTEDLSAKEAAGTTFIFSKSIDLTQFRKGGNFSFNFTYDDSRASEGYEPITRGPYYFTILPYSPKIVEPIGLAKQIEYNNFSLRVLVEDEGEVLRGDPVGSSASLIINHPTKGEMIFNNSVPTLQGKYLVFEWDKNSVLFEKSDVLQSKKKPFQAHLTYWNDNRNYGNNSSNYSFVLVNVTPLLTETHDPVLYMTGSKTEHELIRAYVTYAKGMGNLKIVATGLGRKYENILKGSPAGVNKYEYDCSLPFNKSQAGNYTLSFTYIHDSLEGGSYEFDQKPDYSFQVVPIFIEFKNGNVSQSSGRWNSSYSYTVEVNSSVEADAILQIFNPCSSEWADAGDSQKIKPGTFNHTWPIQPFAYDCDELNSGKYRFRANFQGKDFPSTIAYEGPKIINNEVQLLSLEFNSTVYVPSGSQYEQPIRATVSSSLESGQLRLALSGPEMNFSETRPGMALGDDRYQYEWMIPFNDSHANHNYTLSLAYLHPDLPAEYPLGDRTVQVKPLWISFGGAEVNPGVGRWNDTYAFLVYVNASVDMGVKLEIYNPCSHEWIQRATGKIPARQSRVNLTAEPFKNNCVDAEGKSASYRFVASFADETIESNAYSGPFITGGKPELISLDYSPILHVTKDSTSYQVIKAIVESPLGPAAVNLSINGPNKSFEKENGGAFLGGLRYMYTWSVPFSADNAGNHTISLTYLQSSLKNGSYVFPDQFMEVIYDMNGSTDEPKLIGDLNYTPVLFVSSDKGANQVFSAKVYSPGIAGVLRLNISGKDKNKQIQMNVKYIGESIYEYDGMEPFDASNANSSYRISLDYLLGSQRYSFGDHIMQVALAGTNPTLIWEPGLILGYDPTVYVPAKGQADQLIRATIIYSTRSGKLRLNLSGPNKSFQEVLNGSSLGGNRTSYTVDIPFDESHANNSYKISLAYIDSGLAGGDYRFTDHYMRVLRNAPEENQNGSVSRNQGHPKLISSDIILIGNVTPLKGVIQEWDEKDSLYELTYSLQLKNWTSQEMPWIALAVKPYGFGSSWTTVGEKKKYDPSVGNVSWTIKPFWNTPFLGNAEYKFLIDDMESQTFEGPEIVAIYRAADNWTSYTHNFLATVNASTNLTVCLQGGDNSLPENIRKWTPIGDCKRYIAKGGKQNITWKVPDSRPLYYDFDIQIADKKGF